MKIAICTDNHFGCRNDNPIIAAHIIHFFDNVFFPYVKENGITHIMNCGDIMDRRKYVNYKTANNFRNHFVQPCIDNELTVYNIIGNHDVFLKSSNKINCLEELVGHSDNFRIYTETQEVTLDGLDLLFIPWINRDNYEDTLHKIRTTKAKVAFGHLEITGFEMEKGHICEDGLKKTLFENFDQVYSGHFHLKSDDGKIFYLGTAYQLYWSDYGQTKGFHVFDTDTREIEFIPNSSGQLFYKIPYNDTEGCDRYINYDFSTLSKKSVKIVVEHRENVHCFENFVSKVLEQEPYEFSLVEPVDYSVDNVDTEIDVEDTLSLLYGCVDTMSDSSNNNNRVELKKLFKNLHEEALSIE